MIFTEARFVPFFCAVFAAHWLLRSHAARKHLLLFASYAFYAAWDVRFLVLIVFSTALDFCVGRELGRTADPLRRKRLVVLSVVANLSLLGVFKYLGFCVESARALAQALGFSIALPTLQIVLPVGISFYTFQTLSYSLDVYHKRLRPAASFADFALFVTFFPQLVAGPIVRAKSFLPQLAEPRVLASVPWRRAGVLFLAGFIKKACIADALAGVVDRAFAAPDLLGTADAWLALVLAAVRMYCDFSGYTDMALGLAALLGYQLPQNFASPHVATSLESLWQRWHMTLMSWLRDYVYVPLVLASRPATRARAARLHLVTIFALCGLWHGASWCPVAWGTLHGVAFLGERLLARRGLDPARFAVAGWLWTQGLWVVSGVFRAATLPEAARLAQRLCVPTDGAAPLTSAPHFGWALAGACLIAHAAFARRSAVQWFALLPRPVAALSWGVLWALALAAAASDVQPYVYLQF